MKIFSLETKKHLAGWSVGLGMLLNILTFIFYTAKKCIDCSKNTCLMMPGANCDYIFGWPLSKAYSIFNLVNGNPPATVYMKYGIFWLNLLFWALVVFIVLSLIRHFRNKNEAIHPRTKIQG